MKFATRKKRVFMIAPTMFFSHRGCHVRIYEEAKHLMALGYEVEILTYPLGQDIPDIKVYRIPNVFGVTKNVPGPTWHKVYFDALLLIWACGLYIQRRPDIVHCHLHEGAVVGIFLRLFFRKKFVFDSQGSLVDELIKAGTMKEDSLMYKIFFFVEKYIYVFSPYIIASNAKNKEVIISRFGIPAEKVEISADGVDIGNVKIDTILASQLRERYNLGAVRHVLVYLGTLNAVEGIEELLMVIGALKKKRSDFAVLLMGHPNEDVYRKRIREMGLDETVHVLGKISYATIFSYLSLGTIALSFKLPTTEGNLKLFHYTLAGLPIICYDHVSNRSLIGKHAYYLSYTETTAQHMVSIEKILELNPVDWRTKIAGARTYIKDNFDESAIIKQLALIYENRLA